MPARSLEPGIVERFAFVEGSPVPVVASVLRAAMRRADK
jgi:hypothetical protein